MTDADPARAPTAPSGGGRAVLIIDDEATLGRNIATYLGRLGWETLWVASAEAGLQRLPEFRPDVILLDHNLPGATGLEALPRLLAAEPAAQVVLMTGHGSIDLAVSAMKQGAADYLAKPLALSELRLLLERLLGQHRLARTVDYYRGRVAESSGLDKLLGASAPMQALRERISMLIDAERALHAPPAEPGRAGAGRLARPGQPGHGRRQPHASGAQPRAWAERAHGRVARARGARHPRHPRRAERPPDVALLPQATTPPGWPSGGLRMRRPARTGHNRRLPKVNWRNADMNKTLCALLVAGLAASTTARAEDAGSTVEKCPKKLGVLAVAEPQNGWNYLSQYGLGSPGVAAAHDDPELGLLRRRRARPGHAEPAAGALARRGRRDAPGVQRRQGPDAGGRLRHDAQRAGRRQHERRPGRLPGRQARHRRRDRRRPEVQGRLHQPAAGRRALQHPGRWRPKARPARPTSPSAAGASAAARWAAWAATPARPKASSSRPASSTTTTRSC
ncbi:response regulator receiver domain protein [Ostertagia ostertagi]